MDSQEETWLAAYARAMRRTQALEQEVLLLLLAARAYEEPEELDRMLERHVRSPLDALVRAVRSEHGGVFIREVYEPIIIPASEIRNHLAHNYFRTRRFAADRHEERMRELQMLDSILLIATDFVIQAQTLAPSAHLVASNRARLRKRTEELLVPTIKAKQDILMRRALDSFLTDRPAGPSASNSRESPREGGSPASRSSRSDLIDPFAKAIYAKTSALKKLDLTAVQRARLLEGISDDIKKVSNFMPHQMSRAAHDAAGSLGIDLRQKTWHDQHRFDPKRATFHVEHLVPVSTIRAKCIRAGSDAEVLAILNERLRIVWILKSEDRELTRLGFRDVRDDPAAAYQACNIEIVPDDEE